MGTFAINPAATLAMKPAATLAIKPAVTLAVKPAGTLTVKAAATRVGPSIRTDQGGCRRPPPASHRLVGWGLWEPSGPSICPLFHNSHWDPRLVHFVRFVST